ncbi:hypothetical protein CONLIGDRAFT_685787 [Coniochaeta ligniaria NRRL 30616]|uniref:Uncharacterized protein n=1 Tax=Coniochaeta ligniaria NRRL 30616 TaxID=1408157 RepID=A0A1J7I9M5_9PEZI|nr:hypothetical protein CONLIGDRAFT_685787 [Coniochaeta ligniaria NRRL 30616]
MSRLADQVPGSGTRPAEAQPGSGASKCQAFRIRTPLWPIARTWIAFGLGHEAHMRANSQPSVWTSSTSLSSHPMNHLDLAAGTTRSPASAVRLGPIFIVMILSVITLACMTACVTDTRYSSVDVLRRRAMYRHSATKSPFSWPNLTHGHPDNLGVILSTIQSSTIHYLDDSVPSLHSKVDPCGHDAGLAGARFGENRVSAITTAITTSRAVFTPRFAISTPLLQGRIGSNDFKMSGHHHLPHADRPYCEITSYRKMASNHGMKPELGRLH